MTDDRLWMTTEEAAAVLRCSGATVRAWCRRGLLQCRKLGRSWLVLRADVLRAPEVKPQA